ncbi:unnamed protein product [Spirodela intermedia]|uniref:Uncharacterized protein n=1 Tax=Spirodela intermedia TaxID=51605 RepID=A0A7I8LKW5_SPIIN|nr:unnamed protein product [Spirodela intermedia]
MEAKMFSPPHSRSLRARAPPSRPRAVSLRWLRVSATTGDGPLEEEDGGVSEGKSAAAPRAPPGTLKIRYRSISRKQARKREEEESAAAAAPPPKPPAKAWEEMTVGEKAVELYVGEKGLLFWLNKFAYASIFIVIGGWILFRFVGPSLGFYQLDAAPLSPSSLLKG